MTEPLRTILPNLIVFLTTFQQGIHRLRLHCSGASVRGASARDGCRREGMVLQATILSAYIVITSRRHIVWREYGHIAAYALAGLPLEMILYRVLPEAWLKGVLGVFMVGVAIQGLHGRGASGRRQ